MSCGGAVGTFASAHLPSKRQIAGTSLSKADDRRPVRLAKANGVVDANAPALLREEECLSVGAECGWIGEVQPREIPFARLAGCEDLHLTEEVVPAS